MAHYLYGILLTSLYLNPESDIKIAEIMESTDYSDPSNEPFYLYSKSGAL
jgi:hypothetical protein